MEIVPDGAEAEALEDLEVSDSEGDAVAGGKKKKQMEMQPADGGWDSSKLST